MPVMGEPRISTSSDQSLSATSSFSKPTPPPPPPPCSLLQPSCKKKQNKYRAFRVFRSVFRSFPIITPACKLPSLPGGKLPDGRSAAGTRVTGTLFGYRKGRVSLSIQENPRTLPTLVVELPIQTNVLHREMSIGMVRIALECEKRTEKEKIKILEEPLWAVFNNGKKTGFGVPREASEQDLHLMEILKVISMGAGVMPCKSEMEGPEGEMAYIRAHFECVIGSKDSETLYMLSPDGNIGPELSIFFVRV